MFIRFISFTMMVLSAFSPVSAGEEFVTLPDTPGIQEVTVFQDRALVHRLLERAIQPGKYLVTIDGLPLSLQDDSVRVSGKGTADVRFLDIKVNRKRELENPLAEIRKLEESKREWDQKIKKIEDRLHTLSLKSSFLEKLLELKSVSTEANATAAERSTSEWEKMLEFIDRNLTGIDEEARKLTLEKEMLEKNEKLLEFDLSRLNSQRGVEKKSISLQLEVKKGGKMSATISYIVPGATWIPVYDLRLFTEKDRADLFCQAMVSQETGEEWKNVTLTLSTTSAMLFSTPPELNPLYIDRDPQPSASSTIQLATGSSRITGRVTDPEGNPLPGVSVTLKAGSATAMETVSNENGGYTFGFIPPGMYSVDFSLEGFNSTTREVQALSGRESVINGALSLGMLEEKITVAAQTPILDMKDSGKSKTFEKKTWYVDGIDTGSRGGKRPSQKKASYNTFSHSTASISQVEKSLSATFTLEQKESIPSTAQAQKVTIALGHLPCRREYISTPRQAEFTYLQAKLTNETSFPLLPGKANLFYDENFVAVSEIPQVAVNEDFLLFVGRESGIRVKREFKLNQDESGLFTKKTVRTYAVTIKLENFHKTEESVRVRDLIPLAEDESLQIELIDMSPAPLDGEEDQQNRKEKGILAWEVKLKPGENRSIRYTYRITTPRDYPIYDPEK